MAKDPAFLFYSNDFLSGTFTMSDKQVGQYIRLMCLQHQQGHLSEEKMLSICKKQDPDVWARFIQDEDGLFYNIRLEQEANKRNDYCESRRKNKSSKKDDISSTYDEHMKQHMYVHMENENEIVILSDKSIGLDNGGLKGGKAKSNKFTPPSLEEVREYCQSRNSPVDAKKFWEYFDTGGWVDSKGNPVKNWKQKIITWEGKNGTSGTDKKPSRFSNLKTIEL